MDFRVASDAHPAFVEIIKQLDSEAARLLQTLLRYPGALPIAEVRTMANGEQGWKVLQTHLMRLTDVTTKEPVENPRQAAMVDNWVRLGLVEVGYDKQVIGETTYAWVEQRPEYVRLKASHENDTTKVSFQGGFIGRTALGFQFARAVGLLN